MRLSLAPVTYATHPNAMIEMLVLLCLFDAVKHNKWPFMQLRQRGAAHGRNEGTVI